MKWFIKMLPIYFTIFYLFIHTNALSLETVRAKNVNKREQTRNVDDVFPDWVPFKNKHGNELGEFVPVPKRKLKKRLALPMNYFLRAVAEPEGDDYYDKGQGESDTDDYFEKKDWSDTLREAKTKKNAEMPEKEEPSNMKDTSSTTVLDMQKKSILQSSSTKSRDQTNKMLNEKILTEDQKSVPRAETTRQDKNHKYEDDIDYEEGSADKRRPEPTEEDGNENIRTKASILDSVDEIKERHSEEQRIINEKMKEEEIYKEEREREKIQAQLSNSEVDKYDDNRPKSSKKTITPDYEEYEDKDFATDEKYVVHPETKKTTLETTPASTTRKHRASKEKQVEVGKLSVFKNPQLYIVYDDEFDESMTTDGPKKLNNSYHQYERYSSKIASPTTNKETNERISLVPDENTGKEDEPTLFFPMKRSKKRKNYIHEVPAESSVATTEAKETVNVTASTSEAEPSSTVAIESTAADITDSASTNNDHVTDLAAQSTTADTSKEDNFEEEKGGDKEYHAAHEEEHEEKGRKAYEGVHKETKTANGHHDKENHLGKYNDAAGVDKHDLEESGHYGSHNHEEHGKKFATYEESGKHSKGHNTKGSHDVHKKEEYEKKVEFFEEEGDSAEEEKHGGYNHENSHEEDGSHKNSNYKTSGAEHTKGDSGYVTNAQNLHVSKGHKQAEGFDGHGRNGQAHGQKMGRNAGTKWIYHHAYPAKTANLVRVDRRADLHRHGPQYFG